MNVDVDVEYKDGTEGEIEIYIDLDDYAEFESNSDKIKYIKKLAKKQSDKIKKVLFGKDDLSDLESDIDDMNDFSDILPNETYEEYMEHENFD